MTLTRQELDQAQARLGYVQHPFPAQGTTTDTTHLIIAEHATQEGTYVALTRARDHTHLYAATDQFDPEQPPLSQLVKRVSATDPDIPSIALPLAHEQTITTHLKLVSSPSAVVERRNGIADYQPSGGTGISIPDPGSRPHEPMPTVPAPVTRATTAETSETSSGGHPVAIAAYRIRYAIPDSDSRPLGPVPPIDAFRQRLDRRHAARHALDILDGSDHCRSDPKVKQLQDAEASELTRDYDESAIKPER